jgi:hypothetical protein
MLWMGQDTRLKNGCKIVSRHFVNVRLGSKDCQQIQNVQEQLAVEGWQSFDQMLIYPHGCIRIKSSRGWGLPFYVSYCLGLMATQRLAKRIIVPERNDWFRKVVEISA